MSLTVFLSGYEYKNEYKYEREKRGKTVKQHSPANTIETKKRELNMLSSTQRLIQVDKALYLLETVSGLRELGI
jgi:hypothetical protein